MAVRRALALILTGALAGLGVPPAAAGPWGAEATVPATTATAPKCTAPPSTTVASATTTTPPGCPPTTTTTPPSTTTTPSTAPAVPPSTAPPATVPSSPVPSSTTPPATAPVTGDPGLIDPAALPPGAPDPAAGEAEAEAVPGPVAVPPRPVPVPVTPEVESVRRLTNDRIASARREQRRAEEASAAAVGRVRALEARQARLDADLARARQAEDAVALARLESAREQLKARAVASYTHGPTRLSSLLDVREANDVVRRSSYVMASVRAGRRVLDEYATARASVPEVIARLVSELDTVASDLALARAEAEERAKEAELRRRVVDMLVAGSQVAVNGFVFPVADPHNFVDPFGAPRMFGTPYAHLHEVTDVFAATGTPLVAVERGVTARMGIDTLGGTKLWLAGETGSRYYYAHLSAFAPGLVEGAVVEPGAVIGFVGNTGNAATTPPHLHFEIHPPGGPAINPYPLLKVVDDATHDVLRGKRKAEGAKP